MEKALIADIDKQLPYGAAIRLSPDQSIQQLHANFTTLSVYIHLRVPGRHGYGRNFTRPV
jgi:hypothetical protein